MSHLSEFNDHVSQALEYLDRELNTIRTGRANPALIEDLPVPSYGSTSPLQQLAAIQAPEPRLLVVQPWDPGLVKDIEKAINQSNLGINPVVDGKLIRLPFPPMTAERRQQLVKVVQEKGEEAKVSIRNSREQVMKKIKAAERDHTLSEDAAEVTSKQIQSAVDESHQAISQRLERKIEEITTL